MRLGVNGTTTSTTTTNESKQTQDGTKKPVSKQGVGVWNCIVWGGKSGDTASDGLFGNDMNNGAVKVARSMYNTSNTTVKSTLCYGVQWDATIKFMDEAYGRDSTDRGNYTGTIATTGLDTNYAEKNIYDMAGNVYEWTLEAMQYKSSKYGTNGRILRGGCYSVAGNKFPASYRTDMPPDTNNELIGFRVTLYIK